MATTQEAISTTGHNETEYTTSRRNIVKVISIVAVGASVGGGAAAFDYLHNNDHENTNTPGANSNPSLGSQEQAPSSQGAVPAGEAEAAEVLTQSSNVDKSLSEVDSDKFFNLRFSPDKLKNASAMIITPENRTDDNVFADDFRDAMGRIIDIGQTPKDVEYAVTEGLASIQNGYDGNKELVGFDQYVKETYLDPIMDGGLFVSEYADDMFTEDYSIAIGFLEGYIGSMDRRFQSSIDVSATGNFEGKTDDTGHVSIAEDTNGNLKVKNLDPINGDRYLSIELLFTDPDTNGTQLANVCVRLIEGADGKYKIGLKRFDWV